MHPRGVETLTVTGRRTGRPRRVPVLPVQVGTQRYLVAPYGESEWVRNLRVCGAGELDGTRGHEHFRARELPVEERAEIIEVYRRQAGRTVERLFKSMPDLGEHPVFAVEHAARR